MPARDAQHKADTERGEDALYPKDGLVLHEVVRDLPEPGEPADAVTGNWNMDYVWLSKVEAAGLVPSKPAEGKSVRWPKVLGDRFTRFHLIDTVNGLRYGQRPLFMTADIETSRWVSTVESVDAAEVRLRITATSSAHTRARGVKEQLLGHAVWDRQQRRFTSFTLVGLGRRWGGTGEGPSNDRSSETVPRPLGFLFELAGDTPAEHVPPLYVYAYEQ